jgi:serine/threonine protein kinase
MDVNKLRLLEKIGSRKKLPERVEKLSINQFRLGKKLGSGRFGNVYLVEEKVTQCIYAIKTMNKLKIKEADMQDQVFWEIKLQMYMNHPNILKLYGSFDDSKNIYLVLEYCSNCLFKDFRTKVIHPKFRSSCQNRKLPTTASRSSQPSSTCTTRALSTATSNLRTS